MPSEDASRTDRFEQIRTPDQLQQAKRTDRPEAPEVDHAPSPIDDGTRGDGILGQLRTERAHD